MNSRERLGRRRQSAWRRLLVIVTWIGGVVLSAAACSSSSSPNTPTPQTPTAPIADVVASVGSSTGATGTQQGGAPPVPNGGPAVTATSPGTVAAGTSDAAQLQGATPFQTVYLSIANASTGANVTGYYEVKLPAPTTQVTIFPTIASATTATSFDAVYRVASVAGAVGAPVSVRTTVAGQVPPGVTPLFLSAQPPSGSTIQVADPANIPLTVQISVVSDVNITGQIFSGFTGAPSGCIVVLASPPIVTLVARQAQIVTMGPYQFRPTTPSSAGCRPPFTTTGIAYEMTPVGGGTQLYFNTGVNWTLTFR